eukprot:TRINITY_DN48404_c0_g1_i1.p1 TRINITY_DN48404_c0_g1~~TRINITY_DN48404_c0_g1_i1.p1  ORF type:complete len:182 (+),score=39.10 TRINITY_DN48404_c0_g1_i1:68-547(+)
MAPPRGCVLAFTVFQHLVAITAGDDAGSSGDRAMLFAASGGDLPRLKELVDGGANVNYRSEGGETPLHVASLNCSTPVVKFLLDSKADVNAITKGGDYMSMTPLHWYVNMNACQVEQVRLLLDARAVTGTTNSEGQTPFDMVSKMEHRQDIAALLREEL